MSDTLVINTSTEYINLSVITTTEQYSLSVTPPQMFAYWGTVFGVLSTQTDLWRVLSAKALEVDLQSLSGQVVDLETFIAGVSGTWNGGQEALTVLAGNSAFWDTAFARSTVFSSVSSRYNSSSTVVESNSGNWNFGYNVATYVQANSANWEESSEIIPTVTNYLSTVPVTLSSADVKGQLLSAGTDLFDIFLTSETDSQTLSYVPSSYSLSISNGNTVNLSSINTTFAANSGKYENVYSNVVSNSANWNTAFDRSTVFISVSSRYNSSSTVVENTSANWNTSFNRSTVFSSVSSRYNSTSTAVESNSANWNNAYNTGTVYQANSGSYATYNFVNSNFLNLTGGIIEGNLTLSGNLYIAGSAAIINATDLVISDPLIFLAEGNPSDLLDIGFTGSYNFDGDPHEHTGLVRSHSNKKWTLFSGLTTELLSALTINFNDPSLQIDTLRANLEGNVVGGSVQGTTLSSTGLVYSQGGNSNNWNTAFDRSTQYQNTSASFATNSTVNSVSSQLVLNTDFNNYRTSVAAATATLLPTTIYQNASGNWQGTFTNVQSNSANWNTAFDRSTVFSSVSSRYNSSSTVVESNSANWDTTYQDAVTAVNGVTGKDILVNRLTTGNFDEFTTAYNDVEGFFIARTKNTTDGHIGIVFFDEFDSQVGYSILGARSGDGFLQGGSDTFRIEQTGGGLANLKVLGLKDDSYDFSFPSKSGTLALTDDLSSSEWNSTYTTVQSNSANWNTAFNRSTVFSSVSGHYNSSSTAVESNSANWILDGGNTKNSNITIGTNNNFNLNFETANSTRVIVTSSGQTGFGGYPYAKVQYVLNDDTDPPQIVAWDDRHVQWGTGGDQAPGLGISYSSGDGTVNMAFLEPSIAWRNARMNFGTMSWYTDGVTLGLTQDGSGNVGIKTTTPSSLLDVYSDTLSKSILTVNESTGVVNTDQGFVVGEQQGGYVDSGGHKAQIVAPDASAQTPLTLIGGSAQMEMWKDSTPSKAVSFGMAVPGNSPEDDLIFTTYDGGGWTEGLRVQSTTGNVGIGASAPNEKLTVSGNISATDIIYAQGGNSEGWNTAFDRSTQYQGVSSNWQSTYTTFSENSANYVTKSLALAFSIAL